MGNVRSLTALTRLQSKYRECSIMCFTKTWLNELKLDLYVSLASFQLVRVDRKAKEGVIAMFVNNRWCNPRHIRVKEQLFSRKIELAAMSMRLYYIPREFFHIKVLMVCIPPSADAAAACSLLHTVVSQLQTSHSQACFLFPVTSAMPPCLPCNIHPVC